MSIVAGALCVGDIGYLAAETTRSGATVAVGYAKQAAAALIAIDNANQLVDNYRDQRDIARRGYNISKQQHDHVKTVFWPRDMQFLNEFSVPEAIETVEVMGRRYGGRLAAAVAGAFAVQLKEAKCSARRYCTSANTKAVSDLMMARSTAIGNARVLGRNIAFAEFQARTDTNYERRMQAVARGRGLMQQAARLYASAGEGLASVGARLTEGFNNAAQAFGVARQETAYARQVQTYQNERTQSQVQGTLGRFGNNLDAMGGPSAFGLSTSQQDFMDNAVGDTMLGDTTGLSNQMFNNFPNAQAERQMNQTFVGNKDKARYGTMLFPVIGAPGVVPVVQEVFGLAHVDGIPPGSLTGV